jgi:hypothetical protein
MEEETIKMNKLKIWKFNIKLKLKNIYIKNKNSITFLSVKWEVCEKSKFPSLCQAKEAVAV